MILNRSDFLAQCDFCDCDTAILLRFLREKLAASKFVIANRWRFVIAIVWVTKGTSAQEQQVSPNKWLFAVASKLTWRTFRYLRFFLLGDGDRRWGGVRGEKGWGPGAIRFRNPKVWKKGKDPHPQDKIQHLDFTKDPRPLYYKTRPCAFYHKSWPLVKRAVFLVRLKSWGWGSFPPFKKCRDILHQPAATTPPWPHRALVIVL